MEQWVPQFFHPHLLCFLINHSLAWLLCYISSCSSWLIDRLGWVVDYAIGLFFNLELRDMAEGLSDNRDREIYVRAI